MTNKAYIVVNEQQEREVLEKLEQEGMLWRYSLKKATESIPSHYHSMVSFPYVLKILGSDISLGTLDKLGDYEIVYDGRKEEHMSDKYVVSQEFMNELVEWKLHTVVGIFINDEDISKLPIINYDWWHYQDISNKESNNRLIAIIRWLNGEDVFEVEKTKKWVVRSKERDRECDYGYIFIDPYNLTLSTYSISQATRFDTKEEAQEWANSHQEVIEVEE